MQRALTPVSGPMGRRGARRWSGALGGVLLVVGALVVAGGPAVSGATLPAAAPASGAGTHPAYPTHPSYVQTCAAGVDSSPICERLVLDAIDTARELDGLGPMVLPSDFPSLSVPEQFFVALNRERVDRGLRPFVGMTTALDQAAQRGADTGDLPQVNSSRASTEWLGGVINGLDADYWWLYDDGPGSGAPSCSATEHQGCWADRRLLLDAFDGSAAPVMGAALAPAGDHSSGDRGGTSFAAAFEPAGPASSGAYAYTWDQATAPDPGGGLTPLARVPSGYSLTGIPNPSRNIDPEPDYTGSCGPNGEDQSAPCLAATLKALNAARRLEDLAPMVLPTNFAQLSVPEQIFVAIDLERVGRGLSPFVGLTAPLDANAQRGARAGDDPPDPGPAYAQSDTEWAFGSSNGLDAVYGWMYYDGYKSGNLDCPVRHAQGCWGHRMGILDDFGTGGTLEMGAADDPQGALPKDDRGASSMAATLTVTYGRQGPFVYTWADVLAHLPPAT